jgi:hypothetical protein
MSNTTVWDNPYDHPSLLKRVATPILRCLYRVLPEAVYDAIYFPAFNFYQKSIRAAYLQKMKKARTAGDTRGAMKMERVFKVMKHSLVGSPGLEHTHDLAQEVVDNKVPGAFVECGVAQGGCAALMAQVACSNEADRDCWFFDSYEGLPDPTEADFESGKTGRHIRPLPKGSCLGTLEQVSELLFEEMELPNDKINLVRGWFENTLPKTASAIGPIALLRADGDWYESTRCILENLYDQVAEGGHVIIDDYCSCYGAKKATDEFLNENGVHVSLVPDGRGGASFQKPKKAEIIRKAS